MSSPGFTAEESLDRISERYHMALAVGKDLADRRINPASDNSCPWWLKQTKTACIGVSLWCRDYCGPPEGNRPISGWYPCGICFGFDW